MKKRVKNKNLNTIMLEKYLHSQGAMLCEEGRFDEAVVMLHDAVSIEDQPYTRHQLSQLYLRRGDVDKALDEISRAITLNKNIPEYYYERKKMWLMKGDFENAQIDNEKMLKLDKHYNRIMEILNAVKAFRRIFCPVKSIGGLM
jgi:tetratricopeptide (TPR) repeat protein